MKVHVNIIMNTVTVVPGDVFLVPNKSKPAKPSYGLRFIVHLLITVHCQNYRKPIEHFMRAVEETTLKDISSVAQKLISSPLTLASWGDGMLHTWKLTAACFSPSCTD
jgi:hypothetical protein